LLDKPRVLVIDDERRMLDILRQALSGLGFEVATAEDGQKGIALYSESAFDLVLLDLWMSELDGMEVMRRIRAQRADAMVVVMTGYASIESAVQAMKAGAADYLTKPLDFDHLEIVLRRALEGRRQTEKLRLLEDQVAHQGSFEGLVGVSPEMQQVYDLIRRLADSDATALVQGETGTGKELVARAIHNRSRRRAGRFMPINCGALPENILESELFGHEKGAFTGAIRQKHGLIEQADGGTLFLDEMETMGPALQVKLLRAIQEREVLRVGGDRAIPVDFRLIAATNADLRERMAQGTFRTDLFYRLSVVVVDLPPLRTRRGDVPLLANHFAVVCAAKMGRPAPEISSEAMMVLKAYAWPGNVRELENAIEQAVLLSRGETITIQDLPQHVVASVSEGGDLYDIPLREARERFERQYLEVVLSRAGGRVTEAARRAGIHRRHFYEKMKQCGISRK
jgi:DNA-binding NtrC family response regulator